MTGELYSNDSTLRSNGYSYLLVILNYMHCHYVTGFAQSW